MAKAVPRATARGEAARAEEVRPRAGASRGPDGPTRDPCHRRSRRPSTSFERRSARERLSSDRDACRISCRRRRMDRLARRGRQRDHRRRLGRLRRRCSRGASSRSRSSSAGLSRLHLVVSEPGLEVARSEIAPGDRDRRRTGSSSLGGSARPQRAPHRAPRQRRRRRLDRVGLLPRLGHDRRSVQRRDARLDRQRHRAGPPRSAPPTSASRSGDRSSSPSASRPYSLVHIENMRLATLAGAIVAPPSPAFYVESPSSTGSSTRIACARRGCWG